MYSCGFFSASVFRISFSTMLKSWMFGQGHSRVLQGNRGIVGQEQSQSRTQFCSLGWRNTTLKQVDQIQAILPWIILTSLLSPFHEKQAILPWIMGALPNIRSSNNVVNIACNRGRKANERESQAILPWILLVRITDTGMHWNEIKQ